MKSSAVLEQPMEDVTPRTSLQPSIALVGSPNTGKTSLFNALTGLRAKTANFHGTTVENRLGLYTWKDNSYEVMDLPGLYSLNAVTPEEQVARSVLLGEREEVPRPDLAVVLVDADHLERSLFIVSELIEARMPLVVALNLVDVAERHGKQVDPEALREQLNCPVVPVAAHTGRGLDALKEVIEREVGRHAEDEAIEFLPPPSACGACTSGCPFQTRYSWSDNVAERCRNTPRVAPGSRTDTIDQWVTHPFIGLTLFFGVMLAVFYMIFSLASVPMDLIDGLFSHLGSWTASVLPEGWMRSLVVDGIIGGVGGILVFLPQICILFFFLAVLEDTGYLSRAAFVLDKLMRHVGLPGTAFIPLLAAHACAIPAIMATRVIRNPRDRLVTILVAPLMTCSARIPVYAMITALLFPDQPGMAALIFTGAYMLGIVAALGMAFVFKKTILPGERHPLVLELPGYRIPSLRTVFLQTWDRAWVFVKQAGTIILGISIVLWFIATFPRSEPPPEVASMTATAERLQAAGQTGEASELFLQAERLESRSQLAGSFAGQIGQFIEPVVRPLGYDWQIGIGILTSFAAREVIVPTLSIVYGLGEEGAESEENGLYTALRQATHEDGTPVFTLATSLSLLVFYVLAMQCLPTQAVTKRETNSWKWPVFQLVYMTVLAYSAAWATYRLVGMWG